MTLVLDHPMYRDEMKENIIDIPGLITAGSWRWQNVPKSEEDTSEEKAGEVRQLHSIAA
jgi:hypothetical protein